MCSCWFGHDAFFADWHKRAAFSFLSQHLAALQLMFNSGFKIYHSVIIILLEGGIQGRSWQLCNNGKLSWWGSSVHNRCAKQSRLGSTCWGSVAAEQYKLSQRWSWSVGPPDKQTPARENRASNNSKQKNTRLLFQIKEVIRTVPNQRVM